MPKKAEKDLIGRLADRGEEAIQRLSHAPGADRLLEVAGALRDRVDELQRRMLGLDALESRVEALERRLGELTGEKRPRARAAARKKSG